jgi:hypothetical protein
LRGLFGSIGLIAMGKPDMGTLAWFALPRASYTALCRSASH